ncbi:efflux transporter periplasmic adaptor subunit [Tenacibaculum sp. SZ-18]|uniref:efflux RND transporter periplasmic adaptor subunit n=1 Tax=Tenacibaculum sp. SZ-18 TaxID=754423 RepID=UPI000C2CF5C0|nr:HlyD family efflux transporter periplasmic adaptor subunit [Tenacibaculum sp. SZ-18]AUC17073.1 efflux transporter periplasmic adaptor subunit [Tenacibaculum sp. SZ-18]
MRKLIITGAGLAILALSFLLYNFFKNSKKNPNSKATKIEKTVFVDVAQNSEIPIEITANGNLIAKNKVDVYSEVQGVLQTTGKDFRVGTAYQKGQTLLKINNQEFYASLQSQRSSLQNLIASVMPDLRLDYPESFETWNAYLQNFDINNTLKSLPKAKTSKEKYFISGKNIYVTYYNIKNLEVRLGKYNIKAPFSGVLTEALVTDGTLVRAGQKMGEFIDTSVFELPLSVSASFADMLVKGKSVELFNLEKTKSWKGTVTRINGKIDQSSQTIQIFIEVKGEGLREGMYLEANVTTKSVPEAFELNRKLLVENKAIYVVKNDKLDLITVNPVHFNENSVVVKGITNGEQIVSKSIAGAYVGMPVKIFSEKQQSDKK